jgi:hypothetical protein
MPTALNFESSKSDMGKSLRQEECENYVISFHRSLERFGHDAGVHFDESNWRVIMTSHRTAAERGSESRKRFVNGDIKASFRFFSSVQADGTRFLLILIGEV